VVHLHGLHLSGQLVGGESNDHAGLDDSSLDTAHWQLTTEVKSVEMHHEQPQSG